MNRPRPRDPDGADGRMAELLGSTLDPQGRAFASVAEWHRRAGRLDEARKLVEEGLARHPGTSSGHVVAARIFAELGELARATDAAGAALALDPHHEEMAALLEGVSESVADGKGSSSQPAPAPTPTEEEGSAPPPPAGPEPTARSGDPGGDEAEDAPPEPDPDPDDRTGAQRPRRPGKRRARQREEADEQALAASSEVSILTRTLAELYLKQGHTGRAVAVYREMVRRDPSDLEAGARLRAIEKGEYGPARARSEPVEVTGRKRYDSESAARDLAGEGGGEEGEETAFAWGGDGTEAERRRGRGSATHAVLVLHGPNLSMLGEREPLTYGRHGLPEINRRLAGLAHELGTVLETCQSNHEGEIVDRIEDARGRIDGILINPGGLTHTSVVLRDALVGSAIPFVEVHISNTAGREQFRRRSLVSSAAAGVLYGFGPMGYLLGLRGLVNVLRARPNPTSRPTTADGDNR